MKTLGMDGISINRDTINLRYVEQLADTEQLTALAHLMKYMRMQVFDGKKTLRTAVEETMRVLYNKGWDGICRSGTLPGNLALPRAQEIFACVNRWRELGFLK